jgi:putative nucleotidyltransferase with HDIG domain
MGSSKDKEASAPGRDRRMGAGGRRLAEAFDSVTNLPALAEARGRLLHLTEKQGASHGEVAEALESDAGLTIAVLRAANNGDGPSAHVGGVREAVDVLSASRVRAVASALDTYDVFDSPNMWSERHERFRHHAIATRIAADQVGEATRLAKGDELAVAALLHDVGRLVLIELYGEEFGSESAGESPEDRVHRERRELGIDHALVGAVLVRRWGLRPSVAAAIESHHATDAEGHAGAIRLADLIVHYTEGTGAIQPDALVQAAERVGLGGAALRALLYEYPYSGETRRRAADPCPLSVREQDALRGLAEGKVYKQIAQELSLSVSTVRTHLHNVYKKIGAVDRAQAVLIARDRGWI